MVEVHDIRGIPHPTISTRLVLGLPDDFPHGVASTPIPGPRCDAVSGSVASVVIPYVLAPTESAVGLETVRSLRAPTELADFLLDAAPWTAFGHDPTVITRCDKKSFFFETRWESHGIEDCSRIRNLAWNQAEQGPVV